MLLFVCPLIVKYLDSVSEWVTELQWHLMICCLGIDLNDDDVKQQSWSKAQERKCDVEGWCNPSRAPARLYVCLSPTANIHANIIIKIGFVIFTIHYSPPIIPGLEYFCNQ